MDQAKSTIYAHDVSVARDGEQPRLDYAYHVRTYRAFVKGVAIFVAHVLIILGLMAYFLL